MEKRIGVIAILVTDTSNISRVNDALHQYSHLVLGRQGLPMRDRGVSVISLIVEGDTDDIGALTGKLGRFPGVQVKSVLTAYKESEHGQDHPGEGSAAG
jgi:putative iron-only hydrogenase system regulator